MNNEARNLECRLNAIAEGRPAPRTCPICGIGPCATERRPWVKPEELTKALPTMDVHSLLVERGSVHGDFEENARIAQALKDLVQSFPGWKKLSPTMKEAFHMDILKKSRILSGMCDHPDHWEDICGYNQLVVNHLKVRAESAKRQGPE